MKRVTQRIAWSFLVLGLIGGMAMAAHSGMPDIEKPAPSVGVEEWWADHVFNPESPNYDPTINAPTGADSVNLSSGASITNAVNGAPAAGRVINLAPGTYSSFTIDSKPNIHIVASSGATISGSSTAMYGCTVNHNYHDYAVCLRINHDPECVRCLTDPDGKGFYFKNLTFNGNGGREFGWLHRNEDVMFDDCNFTNFHTNNHHCGVIGGNQALINIWFRDCSLWNNSTNVTTYLDGSWAGGWINCSIEGDYGGGILYLCNDDFSYDQDDSGGVEQDERYISQYNVFYNNTFSHDAVNAIVGAHHAALIKNNLITSDLTHVFRSEVKSSLIYTSEVYLYQNCRMIGNVGANYSSLMYVDNCNNYAPNGNYARSGKYHIRGNQIASGQWETECGSYIDGPNIECGNVTGSGTPDVTCGGTYPDYSCDVAPDAPTGLGVDSVTENSVALSWTSSGGCPASFYNVYRNGGSVGTTNSTAYTDTTVSASTPYTYTVSGENTHGESSQSSPVTTTTLAPDTQAPSTPGTPVMGTVTDSSVAFSWAASTDDRGVAGYTVYRNGGSLGTTTATSYTDLSVACCSSYSYTIEAYDAAPNTSGLSGAGVANTPAVPQDEDLNDDDTVDMADLTVMAGNWLSTTCGATGDINSDSSVDLHDLAAISAMWGWVKPNPNLVLNPGFETDGSPAADWGGPSGGGSGYRDTTVARSGVASFCADGSATPAGGYGYIQQAITLTASTDYALSAWIRSDGTSSSDETPGAWLRYVQLDPSTILYETNRVIGTHDWQQVTDNFTTNADYAGGRLDVIWNIETGDAWFDDVSLNEN